MDESRENPNEQQIPKFRGLYRHVKISVRALDWIIGACIALILIVVAIELRDPGFTVKFDSRGGTDVAAQTQMYGEVLALPQPPAREGYSFAGWCKDAACMEQWNMEEDTVQSSITLYAAWEKIE
jgi:uncharacterized repeat protein (TIGR02543 family)